MIRDRTRAEATKKRGGGTRRFSIALTRDFEGAGSHGEILESHLPEAQLPDPEARVVHEQLLQRLLDLALAHPRGRAKRVAWLLHYFPANMTRPVLDEAPVTPPESTRRGQAVGLARDHEATWSLFRARCPHGGVSTRWQRETPECPRWELEDAAWLLRTLHPGPTSAWRADEADEFKTAVNTVGKWVKRFQAQLTKAINREEVA